MFSVFSLFTLQWRSGRFEVGSRTDKIKRSVRQLAATVIFPRNCVGQALERGNGPRHSLHASTLCH